MTGGSSMATNTYIIMGDPTHLFNKPKNQNLFSQYQKILIDYERQFEEQRLSNLRFSGPLSIQIEFHLEPGELSLTRKRKLEGQLNPQGISLDVLSQFIKILKRAGLYDNEAMVCSLSVSKFYSTEPKIKLTIEGL